MNLIERCRELQKIKKTFFTVRDLKKIWKLDKKNLSVVLNRAMKKKMIIRLVSGIYQLSQVSIDAEKIAHLLYFPNYIS